MSKKPGDESYHRLKLFPARKSIFVIALLLTMAQFSACALFPTEDEPLSAPLLNAYEQRQPTLAVVRRDDLVRTKTISCRSRPIREQTYSFPVGGIYVDRVYVSVGDSVSAGDMLAELERKEILAQVEEAEITVRKQEYALELAKDDSALRREYFYILAAIGTDSGVGDVSGAVSDSESASGAISEAISDSESASGQESDAISEAVSESASGQASEAVSESASSQASGAASEAVSGAADYASGLIASGDDALIKRYEKAQEDYLFGVSYAEKMLEIARRKYETLLEMAEERVIYSTIDGVISYAHRYTSEDRSVAGDKAFTVSDASELIYTVSGDDALFFTPGDVYQMKVSKSFLDIRAYSPEEIGELLSNTPVIYFVPDDLTTGLASYGYITVETDRRDGALYLPANAIIQVGDEYAVYRIGESGFRELSIVNIGVTISGKTEILSGLSEGDEVILD